jgi:Ca2+/Na+ antiporter
VDAVAAFSKASAIPAFFVSFVITPFASNASELVSSLNFAKGKRIKNISLTYCQV